MHRMYFYAKALEVNTINKRFGVMKVNHLRRVEIMQRIHFSPVYSTTERVLRNESILKSPTHTTGFFGMEVSSPGSSQQNM